MKGNNTINWLDVANTYVNYKTLEGVNELARSQQQVANQILSIEQVKQNDNAILSQLVDILSQIRRLLLDSQYNETILLAATGINLYDKYYSSINNADSKLKATEIQVEFLETIMESVSDDSIRSSLQTSLTEFFSSFKNSIKKSIEQIKSNDYSLHIIDQKKGWGFNIGESLVCIEDIYAENGYKLFQKSRVYTVFNIDNTNNVYCIDDLGQKTHLYFGKKGHSQNFAFFESAFPVMGSSIAGLELCLK